VAIVGSMRVLVGGASGAIGRFLVPQLIAAQHEVIGITRTPGSLAGTGASEIIADVLDRHALLAALRGVKADAVVHQLTALKKAPRTIHDMRETDRLRSEGTSTLVAAARLTGATKFVAGSIFYGYGFGNLGLKPVDETSRFGLLNTIGTPDHANEPVLQALLALEEQVHAFGGISLRYGLFYGDEHAEVSPTSRTWNGVLPMVHLSDAAKAVILALDRGRAREVYNIADDNPTTYRDREIAIARAAGLRRPQSLPDGLLRIAAPFGSQLLTGTSVRMVSDKARREIGWEPEFPSITRWADAAAR
jgi:nucleoside-diphosphate-sugar epimerase